MRRNRSLYALDCMQMSNHTIKLLCFMLSKVGEQYTSTSGKYCVAENDLCESPMNSIWTAEECKQKCTANPKCLSAEWYGSTPTQCDLSSTCNAEKAIAAPYSYGVVLFVKQAKPVFTSIPDKYCVVQNDIYESPMNSIRTAEECKQICVYDPKCVSAEWYGSTPTQCDLSSTCNAEKAIAAPYSYGVVLFVKQAKPVFTSIPDKYCVVQNDIYESPMNSIRTAEECKQKCLYDPKCVSAEWYGSTPTQCDLSSTCNAENAITAPYSYRVVLFVKQSTPATGSISKYKPIVIDVRGRTCQQHYWLLLSVTTVVSTFLLTSMSPTMPPWLRIERIRTGSGPRPQPVSTGLNPGRNSVTFQGPMHMSLVLCIYQVIFVENTRGSCSTWCSVARRIGYEYGPCSVSSPFLLFRWSILTTGGF